MLVASDGHPVFACERALDHAIAQAEKESRARGFFRKRSSVPFDGAQICCLPCLGRIDESLLCALAAYGTHDVEFVCCGCETCEHRTGGMMLELVRESASSLIEAFGGELPMRISDELPDRVSRWTDAGASASGMDRRAFLEVAKAESLRAAEVAMRRQAAGVLPTEDAEEVPHPGYAHVDEAGTLSHLVPTRRRWSRV